MKNLNKIYLLFVLAGLFACTGDFEDINTNPNSPETAPSSAILTWVQRVMSGKYGDVWANFNEGSSMAGHITKVAYIDESKYAFRTGTVDGMFSDPYVYIRNLNRILLNEEGEGGNPNMTAVALIHKCYIYHLLTDHLKAIPYSDAFQAEEGNFTPKYDSQESIYRDMLEVLKNASNMINENPPAYNRITGADIIYGGNVTRWKKFANSLRLRLAVRMSYVDEAGAKAVISEILGNPAMYPLLSSNADNARFKWPGDANYREPLSASELSRHDYVVCSIITKVLSELDDPRLPVYVQKTGADKVYRGLIAGTAGVPGNVNLISKIGTYFADNVAGYTIHFRYAEVEFLKAEIYERGLYSGDAEAAYNAGITASMAEYASIAPHPSIDQALVAPYLALPKVAYTDPELPNLKFAGNVDYGKVTINVEGTNVDVEDDRNHNCIIPEGIVLNECANPVVKNNPKLQKIAYQKWLALYQQGLEAWAEVRRTDIPIIGPAPGRAQGYAAHNRCPTRYPYSFNELSVNADNLQAVSSGIVHYYWGQQMWWDKRTGVQ